CFDASYRGCSPNRGGAVPLPPERRDASAGRRVQCPAASSASPSSSTLTAMKATLLLALAFVSPSAFAQDWTAVNVGTTADLHDVLLNFAGFPAYVAGDDGFVASSLD